MGTFTCDCGYVIRDSEYPCPAAGQLIWDAEQAAKNDEAYSALTDYFRAAGEGRKAEWVRDYFGERYPINLPDADVVREIYRKISFNKGRNFYRCPECEGLYVQKQLFTNEWESFVRVA